MIRNLSIKMLATAIVLPALLLASFIYCNSASHAADSAGANASLRSDFAVPPASYRTYVWWHWLGLSISKYGIKRDLTAMKEAGVAGATICPVGSQANVAGNITNSGVPAVRYWSPKFWRMVQYAVKVAKHLHLKLGMENCPGWDASGGPWITPAAFNEEGSLEH